MLPNPPTPVKPSTFRTNRLSPKRLWNWGRFVLGIIGLVLVTYTVSRDDSLLETVFSVDLWYVFIALMLNLVAMLFKTLRWWLVLKAGKLEMSIQRLFGTYLVGTFFTQFMPGSSMGGDAIRMMELGADSGRMIASVSSVLVERAIGLLTVFASASVILLVFPNNDIPSTLMLIVHAVTLIGGTGLFVLRMGWFVEPFVHMLQKIRLGKVGEKIVTLSKALQGQLGNANILGKMIILSFLANACTMTATYMGLLSVHESVNFWAFIPLISLAVAVELVPISPGALGLREGIYLAFLHGILGVSQSAALTTALIVRGISFAQGILGGFVLMARALDNRSSRSPSTTLPS